MLKDLLKCIMAMIGPLIENVDILSAAIYYY